MKSNQHRFKLSLACFFVFLTVSLSAFGQDCLSGITFVLKNIHGGVYKNQSVELKELSSGKSYKTTSNELGEATLNVPCEQKFSVHIANYTQKSEITSPRSGTMTRTLSYEPDMAKKDELFAMNDAEKADVDRMVAALPDTTFVKGSAMSLPKLPDLYAQVKISIVDLENAPLTNEVIMLSGLKNKKTFKGTTNEKGQISLYLPKGDEYAVHFRYHKNYRTYLINYTKGSAQGGLDVMYMGTKEYLLRKKQEEERIKAEELRLAEEKRIFAERCKKLKISEEEGHRREALGTFYAAPMQDTVVSTVLNRNKWNEKLIVCDLTGSMNPYAAQLSAWYQLNYKLEKNLQFVFFNDGDEKADSKKVIGSTGGIYYQKSKGLDSLVNLMSKVRTRGSGGDCPENNMEALIKGVKMAAPYKELVMVVDNNAPVKDISLLKNFNQPVHIILCGYSDAVLADYLLIAWKTKGSIHTIEEDITKIAKMLEGESIKVGGVTYRIMGGEFVRITKV